MKKYLIGITYEKYLCKIPMKNTHAKYLWKSTYEKCLSMTHIDEISIMKNTFRKMVCV